MKFAILAVTATLIAAPALAFEGDGKREIPIDDPAIKSMAAAAGAKEGTELICKRMPPPTGTRLGSKKVCKTELQWTELREENKDAMDRMGKMGLNSEDPFS